MFADQDMGRPVVAPPDVPADRVAALRRAFDATMKDKEFLADAAKMAIDIDPIDGKAVERHPRAHLCDAEGCGRAGQDIYAAGAQPK